MKTIIYFVCIFLTTPASSQDVQNYVSRITENNAIESMHISCFGHKSEIFMIADSLIDSTSTAEKITLFRTASHAVKYYVFMGLLKENDSLAFEELKRVVSDTTMVECRFSGFHYMDQFNHIIIEKYYNFITLKYKYGRSGTIDNYSYQFSQKNKKKYREKLSALKHSLVTNESKVLLRDLETINLIDGE